MREVMRAPLSIVIPTLNAGEALPGCLVALMEGVESGLIRDLVISDGGSTDQTREIAEDAGAELVAGAASRGEQLRRGAQAAMGAWLLFLHADTQLQPGWSDAVREHIENHEGQAGWFGLAFDRGGMAARLVAGWANLRARVFGLPFGDQGLLMARTLYEAVGGYEGIALMEDVAIARALGRKRMRRLSAIARTSARRYAREGWLRRGGRNLWIQLRFFAGASPERLSQRYRR